MSSLQQQLKKLQTPISNPKAKPSLLFDKREAADIDKETILSISLKALHQLVQEHPQFEEFESLFRLQERMLMTIPENEKLDVQIHQFLKKLSPLFLDPICFHVLEWLVRGLSIHQRNVRSCIEMMIPFHDTDEYQKLLDLLELGEYQYIKTNIMGLGIHFVNAMQKTSVEMGIKNSALSSFYVSYLIRHFNNSCTDNDIRAIFPEFVGGLESSDKEQSATMLMIFAFLTKKIQFEKETLDQLLEALAAGAKYHIDLALKCLVSVCASQKVEFTKEFLKLFVTIPKLDQSITKVAEKYEVQEFLTCLLVGLLKVLKREGVVDLIIYLTTQSFVTSPILSDFIRAMLESIDEKKEKLGIVLKHVQRIHLHELDRAIQAHLETLGNKQKKRFRTSLATYFGSSLSETLQDHNVTLFLGLQHPETEVRVLALKRLGELLRTDSVDFEAFSFAGPILLNRLQDSPKEVELVLKMEHLLSLCEWKELMVALGTVLQNSKEDFVRSRSISLLVEITGKKPALNGKEVQEILLGSLLTLMTLKNGGTLVNNILSRLHLGSVKKYEEENEQEYARKFVNHILDSVVLSAKANQDTVAQRFIDGLGSSVESMKVLSVLVLNKLVNDQLLSPSHFPLYLGHIKSYFQIHSTKRYSESELKNENGYPSASFGSWYAKGNWEMIKPVAYLNALQIIIDKYQGGALYYFGPKQGFLNQLTEVILFTKKMAKDLSKQLLSKQVGGAVLEFSFGALNAPVPVLSTCLTIGLKYLQLNTKSSKPMDLQVVYGPLLLCLSHPDKSIRALAVELLSEVKRSLDAYSNQSNGKPSKSSIYGYNTFYGTKSDTMQFLQLSTAVQFVGALMERSHDIIADGNHLQLSFNLILKRLSNQKVRDEVITFLSSVILAMLDRKPKYALLSFLKDVDSPIKIRKLGSTISTEISSLSKDAETDPRYLTTLISCFAISDINTVFLKQSGGIFDLYSSLLTNYDSKGEILACCSAIAVISHKWFSSLDLPLKQRIFGLLMDALGTGPTEVKEIVKLITQDVAVTAEVVEPKLAMIIQSLQDTESKRFKSDSNSEQSKIFVLVSFLEFLQGVPPEGLLDLVPRIVLLLDGLLNFPIESFLNVEYCKQLVLSVLEGIIRNCQEASEMTEESFRVDLIVQCIRITDNPQTHNAALLLLAAIGLIHSNIVLVNIMPVFTFMGANILRQDDNYSFHVVQKTLETIIPSLIQGDEDPLVYVKNVLQVFVNALEHVPSHRRLKLFTILAQTIGPEQYLSALLTLLIAQPMIELEKALWAGEAVNVKRFSMSLLQEFDHPTQLRVLTDLMNRFETIPDEPAPQLVPAIVDTSVLKVKTIRLIKLHVLQFVDQFLKTMDTNQEEKQKCGSLYMELLESQLAAISIYAKESENTAWNKYAGLLSSLLYNNLDTINEMITLDLFLDVMNNLIVHDNQEIQKRSLEMFQERIRALDSVEVALESFDPIFETLIVLLQKEDVTEKDSENKQEVLLSIAVLVGYLKDDSKLQKYQNTLQLVISHGLQHSNLAVSSTSMITVSALVNVLKARAIPFLNKIVPLILQAMTNVVDPEALIVVYNCSITSLMSMVETIPQFLSSYLGKFLALLCEPKAIELQNEELDQNCFEIISLMCKQIEPRVLIPCFLSQTLDVVKSGSLATARIFTYLTELISSSLQSSLVDYHKEWITLFIDLFSSKPSETTQPLLLKLFVKYTMKLNEKTFKPLFIKMYDWAQDEERGDHCLFFKLVLELLENLKSIFVPYFAIVLDLALELVSKERSPLWNVVVQCFLNCFSNDSVGFMTEEKFEKIVPVLIDLLDNDSDSRDYKDDMGTVVTALGAVCKACHSEVAWKKLNKLALMKTRSDSANIRWAGLKVVHEMYSVLGEEMLAFFPETIPFLSEVMEDINPEVEMACQELCAIIQKYLGEPIQQYFSTS